MSKYVKKFFLTKRKKESKIINKYFYFIILKLIQRIYFIKISKTKGKEENKKLKEKIKH